MTLRLPHPLWIFLTTLALVVAGVALRFGISIHAERLAVAEILKHGGWVGRERRGPDWLRERLGDERMRDFDTIWFVKFHNDEAAFLRRFFKDDAQVIAFLDKASGSSACPNIDDGSISCIRKIPSVRHIDLGKNDISDVGIEHVCSLHNLEFLDAEGTDVSDASIPHLKRLTKLKALRVGGTKLTEAGIAELKKALPQLTVYE